ncbi:hypothetical protein ABFS82_08G089700 [Erythranthe guttata]
MGKSCDFEFWEESLPIKNHTSPPRWTKPRADFRQETQALIPQNDHQYSRILSPKSRVRAIEDGRRELMEMVKNIPESSYELSLKDIVDGHQNVEQVKEKKKKHKAQQSKKTKSGQMCRTASMESEMFLLKVFVPVTLSFKKKPKAVKNSEICAGPSSDKQRTKNWWKMVSLAVKDNQNSRRSNISSNRNSKKYRKLSKFHFCLIDCNMIHCQLSSSGKKCKPREQRGCLF